MQGTLDSCLACEHVNGEGNEREKVVNQQGRGRSGQNDQETQVLNY
jgi:hypothetical protein